MTEETHYFTPTVVYRAGGGAFEAAVVDHAEKGRALLLFASEVEATGYRLKTGNYPAEEGFVNVPLDSEALEDLIALHGCSHVVMPVSLTGEGGPDYFSAGDFVGMLQEPAPA